MRVPVCWADWSLQVSTVHFFKCPTNPTTFCPSFVEILIPTSSSWSAKCSHPVYTQSSDLWSPSNGYPDTWGQVSSMWNTPKHTLYFLKRAQREKTDKRKQFFLTPTPQPKLFLNFYFTVCSLYRDNLTQPPPVLRFVYDSGVCHRCTDKVERAFVIVYILVI